MSDILKGRVAIVTGSGQGVGRALAIGLAKHGAIVVTNNRKPGASGSAMLTNCLNWLAPSISAASYSASGMAVMKY